MWWHVEDNMVAEKGHDMGNHYISDYLYGEKGSVQLRCVFSTYLGQLKTPKGCCGDATGALRGHYWGAIGALLGIIVCWLTRHAPAAQAKPRGPLPWDASSVRPGVGNSSRTWGIDLNIRECPHGAAPRWHGSSSGVVHGHHGSCTPIISWAAFPGTPRGALVAFLEACSCPYLPWVDRGEDRRDGPGCFPYRNVSPWRA